MGELPVLSPASNTREAQSARIKPHSDKKETRLAIRLSVDQMIATFGSTYRTIDLRSAVVKQGSVWTNVYTVIRFTYEEPEAAKRRLLDLEAKHGVIATKSFQVRLGSLPFPQWSALCQGLSTKGHIGEIAFSPNIWINLTRTPAFLRNDYSAVRPFDSREWPVAQFSVNTYGVQALATDTLVGETTRKGYPDPYDAVNLLCELNVQSNQSQGCELYLSLPAFAMVSGLHISTRHKRIWVEIRRHAALQSLDCQVLLRGQDHQRSEPWKHRLTIKPETAEEDGHMIKVVASSTLPEARNDDWAEAQILHSDIGELHTKFGSVRQLIPPAQRNILFEALTFFCDESELKNLVVRPFDEKGPRMKVSAGFELRIAWLLGLLGLSTVILGEYEDIIAPKSGVKRGSIDILAASQRHDELVLAACTIAAPKDEDFNNLRTSAEILDREVFTDASVRIIPLVCTCAPGVPVEGGSGIPVLDADRLDLALQLVKAGHESDVLSFIGNPSHYELRHPTQREP